ncbi:MAG: hypothetical protein WC093_03590 [Methanoculleus sp.]
MRRKDKEIIEEALAGKTSGYTGARVCRLLTGELEGPGAAGRHSYVTGQYPNIL